MMPASYTACMKNDIYIKAVLTFIALFLGIIAFERSSPSKALADGPNQNTKFANILFAATKDTRLGQTGHDCYFFDTLNGTIWEYDGLGTGVENACFLGRVKELGKPVDPQPALEIGK
jgi:hypothetical protein